MIPVTIWKHTHTNDRDHVRTRHADRPHRAIPSDQHGHTFDAVDPFDRLRSARRHVTDPVESLAQAIAERVVDVVVQALDMNEIISRIDLTAALDQVDVNHVLDRVDVDRLLGQTNVDGLIGRVDVDGLIGRVDVDRLIGRVDVDGLIERVDVDRLIERVDVDAVVGRVDVDGLLDRVDVNALINRLDIDTLVGQTDLGSIIARSTSGFASEALDTLRGQAVMIDQFVDRTIWRMERRKGAQPQSPSDAAPREGGPPTAAMVLHQAVAPTGAHPRDTRSPHHPDPTPADALPHDGSPAAGSISPPQPALVPTGGDPRQDANSPPNSRARHGARSAPG